MCKGLSKTENLELGFEPRGRFRKESLELGFEPRGRFTQKEVLNWDFNLEGDFERKF